MSKEGIRPHLCKNIYPDWTKNRNAPGHVCLRSPKTDNLYNSRNSRWEIHILVHEHSRKIISMDCREKCHTLKCHKIYKKLKANCANPKPRGRQMKPQKVIVFSKNVLVDQSHCRLSLLHS